VKSFKLKLVLGGSSGSGKTSFIDGNYETDWPIGVSFKSIECHANENDTYKFIVWDLKDRPQFRFLFKDFCRGAYAGLICFDLSNRESFYELERWIDIIRRSAGDIPIILIGTKKDLDRNEVKQSEITQFVEEKCLQTVFFTSIFEEEEPKKEIFKFLVNLIDPGYPLENFSIFPRELENAKFQNFLQDFSTCPICKNKLHYESLKYIYFNDDERSIEMRKNLFTLIDELFDTNNKRSFRILVGIPCCKCYKKIFPE